MIDEQDKMEYDGCLLSYTNDDLSSPVDIVIKEYINQEIYIYIHTSTYNHIYLCLSPGVSFRGYAENLIYYGLINN